MFWELVVFSPSIETPLLLSFPKTTLSSACNVKVVGVAVFAKVIAVPFSVTLFPPIVPLVPPLTIRLFVAPLSFLLMSKSPALPSLLIP